MDNRSVNLREIDMAADSTQSELVLQNLDDYTLKTTAIGSTFKQERSENTTQRQYLGMLHFVQENPLILETSYSRSNKMREKYLELWKELSDSLNNMDGPTKNVDKWMKSWTDWKYSVHRKAEVYNLWREGPGSTRTPRPLTTIEEQLLDILIKHDETCETAEKQAENIDGDSIYDELKTSSEHFENLIKFMENHSDMAQAEPSAVEYKDLWEELRKQLNSLGDCQKRSVTKWQKIWMNYKKYVKRRVEEVMMTTGDLKNSKLSDLEQRVVELMKLEIKIKKYGLNKDVPKPNLTAQRNEIFLFNLENANDSNCSDVWNAITNSLNDLYDEERGLDQWKKCWVDWKYKVRRKQQTINDVDHTPGQGTRKVDSLLPIEIRLLKHLGEYKDPDQSDENEVNLEEAIKQAVKYEDDVFENFQPNTIAAADEGGDANNTLLDASRAICRICMESSNNLHSIFLESNLADRIMNFADVQVDKDDGLPDTICLDCLNLLDSASLFKRRCESSDKMLRGSSNTSSESKPSIDVEFNYVDCFDYEAEDIKEEELVDTKTDLAAFNTEKLKRKRNSRASAKENKGYKIEHKTSPGLNSAPVVNYNKLENALDNESVTEDDHFDDRDEDFVPEISDINESDSNKKKPEIKSPPVLGESVPTRYRLPTKRLNRHKSRSLKSADVLKDKTLHQCDLCGIIFKYRIGLMSHMRSHTDYRPYECPHCKKGFKGRKMLEIHVRTHTGERPYVCEICGQSFTQEGSLTYHRLTHTGEKTFMCPECPYMARSSSNLQIHSRHHSGARPYPCTYCTKSFTTSSNLHKHKRRHLGERNFKVCGRRFLQQGSLHVHSRIHKGLKRFSCKLCNYTCDSNSDLRKHSYKHTGERKYQCDLCGLKFTVSCNLQKHKRNVHERRKNAKCDQCNKSFYSGDTLRRHMVTHTGAKPYSCPVCPLTYGWIGGFKKHMRTQHPGIPVPKQSEFNL